MRNAAIITFDLISNGMSEHIKEVNGSIWKELKELEVDEWNLRNLKDIHLEHPTIWKKKN